MRSHLYEEEEEEDVCRATPGQAVLFAQNLMRVKTHTERCNILGCNEAHL